jgi:hypothetical protein
MSPISFSPSALKEGRLYEYMIRFALGGAATAFTGLASAAARRSEACSWRFRRSSARARP